MKRLLAILILLTMVLQFMIPFISKPKVIKHKELKYQQNTIEIEDNIQKEENKEVDNVSIAIENMNLEMKGLNSIKDKKEWFIEYKKIIEKYSHILDSPETIYDYYAENELDLLFRVVQAEIGEEYTFEQKCNVASVIFNRIGHKEFGSTISEVLTDDQFCTVRNGAYKKVEVSETTILACEYAFMIEDTTDGCLFFDSNNELNYQFAFNDNAHNFYRLKEN